MAEALATSMMSNAPGNGEPYAALVAAIARAEKLEPNCTTWLENAMEGPQDGAQDVAELHDPQLLAAAAAEVRRAREEALAAEAAPELQ